MCLDEGDTLASTSCKNLTENLMRNGPRTCIPQQHVQEEMKTDMHAATNLLTQSQSEVE